MEPDHEQFINPEHALAAQGVGHIESLGHAFHVTNARPGDAEELAEGMDGLEVNLDGWDMGRLARQIEVENLHGEPPRLVIHNFAAARHEDWDPLHRLVHQAADPLDERAPHPVRSVWMVHQEGEEVPQAVLQKAVLRCHKRVDAHTLLEAVAFGWGAKGPYPTPEPAPEVNPLPYPPGYHA